MGTILASAIVTSARATLLDPSPGKTWTDARFLVMFNEALRRMVSARKDTYTVQGPITLAAGHHQALPAGGTQLYKLLYNTVSKAPINQVSESLLLEELRFATYPTEQVDVESYAVDIREPTRFIVTPPNDGTGSATGLYGGTPSIASLANVIPCDDLFEPVVRLLLIAEAYRADTTRQDLSKTQQYTSEALAMLGLEDADTGKNHPPLGKPGGQ